MKNNNNSHDNDDNRKSTSNSDRKTIEKAKKKKQLNAERKNLPIYECRQQLIEEIKQNDCLVIMGETGSGKTTRKFPFTV